MKPVDGSGAARRLRLATDAQVEAPKAAPQKVPAPASTYRPQVVTSGPALQAELTPVAGSSAQQRLLALIHPLTDAAPSPAPPPAELEARIAATLGSAAEHLSALETAAALGHASWAEAVAALPGFSGVGDKRAPSFLLAAKLTQFMENAFAGVTLDEVAVAFGKSTPGVKERFGTLDGARIAALQKAYGFMPQWSVRPHEAAPAANNWDWMDLPEAQNLYTEQLSHALEQLGQVSFAMNVTREVGERASKTKPFAKANVVMVQHALGQADGMVDALVKGGLDPQRAEYVFIPYQQAPAVKLTLGVTYGLPVTAPPTGDVEAMYAAIGQAVDRAYAQHRENGEPVLIFDDGGYASKWVAEHYPDDPKAFKVVEQTTRGLTEISAIDPKFPVVNVAGSYGKRLESDQIGDAIYTSVMKVLDMLGQTPHAKDVLVVGAGKVGLSTAKAALEHDAKSVSVYDPFIAPARKKELEGLGIRVISSKQEALDGKFLIIGASGQRSIEMQDILAAASDDPDRPVFLATGSSKRVEVDHVGLEKLATDEQGRLRRFLVAKVNEQQTYSYWLKDGRMVTSLADDLPVNFQGINSVAPEEIDATVALMIEAGIQALSSEAEGLVELDQLAQFDVQARKSGLTVGAPGAGQQAITLGTQQYSGTVDQWAALAKSAATPPRALTEMFKTFHGSSDPALAAAALAALGPTHDVTDELFDAVLELSRNTAIETYLPAVAGLLENPSLRAEQQEQLLGWLKEQQTKRVAWLGQRQLTGASLDLDPETLVLTQLITSHPRERGHIEMLLNEPLRMLQPRAANVFAVMNPSLTADELRVLARNGPGYARPINLLKALPYAVLVSQAYRKYVFDVWQSIARHPSAGPDVRALAEKNLATLTERTHNGVALGVEHWSSSNPFGRPLPEYHQFKYAGGMGDEAVLGHHRPTFEP